MATHGQVPAHVTADDGPECREHGLDIDTECNDTSATNAAADSHGNGAVTGVSSQERRTSAQLSKGRTVTGSVVTELLSFTWPELTEPDPTDFPIGRSCAGRSHNGCSAQSGKAFCGPSSRLCHKPSAVSQLSACKRM